MTRKVQLIEYTTREDYGTRVVVNGKVLFQDGTYTFGCLQEIFDALGINVKVEYFHEEEEVTYITKKCHLVEDEE